MPLKQVIYRPGINTIPTETKNEGGISDGNLIRWRQGLAERIGGWEALSTTNAAGVIRAMHGYQDLSNTKNLLLGTDGGAQVFIDGVFYTFSSTSFRTAYATQTNTSTLDIEFFGGIVPAAGGTTVVVNDVGHGAVVGDIVKFPIQMEIGGFLFPANSTVAISSVASVDAWEFTMATAAVSSSATMPQMRYDIEFHTPTIFVYFPSHGLSNGQLFTVEQNTVLALAQPAGTPIQVPAGNYTVSNVSGSDFQISVDTATSAPIAAGSGLQSVIASTNISCTISSAVQSGDLILLFHESVCNNLGSFGYGGTPTGYNNLLFSINIIPGGVFLAGIWYKIATGTETTAVINNFIAGTTPVQQLISIIARGVHSTLPIQSFSSNLTHTTPGLYTQSASTMVLAGLMAQSNATLSSRTPDAGWNEIVDSQAGVVAPWNTIFSGFYIEEKSVANATTFIAPLGLTMGTANPTLAFNIAIQAAAVQPLGSVFSTNSTTFLKAESYNAQTGQTQQTPLLTYFETFGANNSSAWSLDNLGNNGLFNSSGGPIYVFTPPVSIPEILTNASVTDAPQRNNGMFTAMPQAQIIAFGTSVTLGDTSSILDPLLVRFSDAGSFSEWTASADNLAGSFRLSRGSLIVGGIQAPQATLLWTDLDLWSMQFIGAPLVYSFNIVGSGCGLVAMKARGTLGRSTYWMSQKQFFVFDGSIKLLPCPVWDNIFPEVSDTATDPTSSRIHCAVNSAFHEVAWFFPSSDSTECDRYVKYNESEQAWDYGTLTRTAWVDQSVFGLPLGADINARIQQHEIGFNADTMAIEGSFIETAYSSIQEGDYIVFVDFLIPDFKWAGEGGQINITITTVNYPFDGEVVHGPFAATPTNPWIPVRLRGTQAKIKFEWEDAVDFNARFGAVRFRVAPSGRRP